MKPVSVFVALCLLLTGRASAMNKDIPNAQLQQASAMATDVFAKHDRLLVGDIHGTREIPWLVQKLVAFKSASDPVSVGLECPTSMQEPLNAFYWARAPLENSYRPIRFGPEPIKTVVLLKACWNCFRK
jgi:hypothetical protein